MGHMLRKLCSKLPTPVLQAAKTTHLSISARGYFSEGTEETPKGLTLC